MPPTMEEGACNLRPIGPRGIFTCMHCKPLDTNRWYIQHIHQLAMLYNYCNMYYDLAITFVMTCICKSVFSLEKRLSTHKQLPYLADWCTLHVKCNNISLSNKPVKP